MTKAGAGLKRCETPCRCVSVVHLLMAIMNSILVNFKVIKVYFSNCLNLFRSSISAEEIASLLSYFDLRNNTLLC